MVASSPPESGSHAPLPTAQRRGQLLRLLDVALQAFNGQFDAFVPRLVDALMTVSEQIGDSKQANLHFNAANLLNNNRYVFFHVASSQMETVLRHAITSLENDSAHKATLHDSDLSLVPYTEMDNKVVLGTVARYYETELAEPLNALNIRLAFLVGRDSMTLAQNPFRPDIWLDAIHASWCEFDPDTATHALILPLLKPNVFLGLRPIFDAVNNALITGGVLPELSSAFRIRKSNGNLSAATTSTRDAAIRHKLRDLFASERTVASTSPNTDSTHSLSPQAGIDLLDYVSQLSSPISAAGNTAMRLSDLKQRLPIGAIRAIDETTIDLLIQVFDSVFAHQLIPQEIKNLIGILQIPMLKTALHDKDFFYSGTHPARKLIDLLSRTGVGWDQATGLGDPLYQTMKRTVERAQTEQSPDGSSSSFAQAVRDLEAFLHDEDTASTTALDVPITQAIRGEKIRFATRAAKNDVAERISTGEVVPFVETFLENRWIAVLTLAHSIEQDRPELLTSAIKTMDDLLWSVRPKATTTERKELIARLPTILAMLNKWLNVTKWDDADRLQFFADLADAHASIVRAPLDLTPERQLEIAVDVAKKAAERRIALRSQTLPEPEPDALMDEVTQLQKGTWIEIQSSGSEPSRVKLVWVSPLRSVFIFSAGQRRESFSFSAEELVAKLRDNSARLLEIDGIVDRALARALIDTDHAELEVIN